MASKAGALGEYLRQRRDATTPESVGMDAGPRRRAPGLRRAELAVLAGISVEYLVRIEQGRDRNPSPQVLRSLSDALRLEPEARAHLRTLAALSAGECVRSAVDGTTVRDATLELVRQLEPGMAFLVNRFGDVLAHTSDFALLAGPLGLLEADRPNLTRFLLADARSREAFPEWESLAQERAFELWMAPDGARSRALTSELVADGGRDVLTMLAQPSDRRPASWTWRHRVAGDLRFSCERLELPASDAQTLFVLVPSDDVTRDAMAALRRTHGTGLHAVG